MSPSTGKRMTGNVLVLGTDTRVILAVARSLGRRGLRVHLAWCDPQSIARHSRYVAAYHALPAYSPHNDDWKKALHGLVASQPFDLVIPCNDSTVVPIQRFRSEFLKYGTFYLLPDDAFDVAFDKLKTYELARSRGVPVAEGGAIYGEEEALALYRRLQPPIVLKPRATITLDTVKTSNVVRRVDDEKELCTYLRQPEYCGGAQLQEYFRGTGVGIEVLCSEGEILFAFQHVRIHETMEYGSSYRRSAVVQPELLEDARKLMRGLRHTGIAMAEFIVDFTSGRRVFLEINGRFWGSLPLAIAAGADFPYYLYQMLVEGRREFPQSYDANVYCRNLLLDWQARRRWLSGSLPRRAWVLATNAWQVLTRDRLDSCARDDMRPAWRESRQFADLFWSKVQERLTRRPAPSPCWNKT